MPKLRRPTWKNPESKMNSSPNRSDTQQGRLGQQPGAPETTEKTTGAATEGDTNPTEWLPQDQSQPPTGTDDSK